MKHYPRFLSRAMTATLVAGLALMSVSLANAADKVRVAMGDVVSVETLAVVVALERAKDRGVDYELTSFAKEQLAIQSVINGQADVGIGTPYSVIQKSKVPLKIVFQVSRLVFFPVASVEYKTWQDLNGQPFTFHGRGSGTEAIGDIIAKQQGIEFGERSYVPGSENRIIAMMNGQIRATIVDLANKNKLMQMGGDKFHVLPGLKEPASDELVFASDKFIYDNSEQVNIIVEEMLKLWREMKTNPGIIEEERARRNLIADQPKEVLDDVVPFYTQAAGEDIYNSSGDGEAEAKADFGFFTLAGQMQGDPADLAVEDYWNLGPLNAARAKLGN